MKASNASSVTMEATVIAMKPALVVHESDDASERISGGRQSALEEYEGGVCWFCLRTNGTRAAGPVLKCQNWSARSLVQSARSSSSSSKVSWLCCGASSGVVLCGAPAEGNERWRLFTIESRCSSATPSPAGEASL